MKASFIEKQTNVQRKTKYAYYTSLLREAIAKQKTLKIEFDSLDDAHRARMSLSAMISRTKLPLIINREGNILYCTPR